MYHSALLSTPAAKTTNDLEYRTKQVTIRRVRNEITEQWTSGEALNMLSRENMKTIQIDKINPLNTRPNQ